MFGKHSRWAIGLYVAGWIVYGSLVAKGDSILGVAFLASSATMRDIRISRLP